MRRVKGTLTIPVINNQELNQGRSNWDVGRADLRGDWAMDTRGCGKDLVMASHCCKWD